MTAREDEDTAGDSVAARIESKSRQGERLHDDWGEAIDGMLVNCQAGG